MDLTLNVKKEDQLSIVYASGEVDAVTCGTLEDCLNGLIDQGQTRIVLDLEAVPYISSAGLRSLLTAAQKLDATGKFVLSRLNEEVMEILEMTGFTNILECFDALQDAKEAASR